MFTIREDDLTGKESRALIALHLAGMHASSPPGHVFALDLSGLQSPEITVWSAWHGDQIASIGALKMLESGQAEIKSMRAHPACLGTGAGAAMLDHIVDVARQRGVRRLSLETGIGPAFEAAWKLYQSRGFTNGEAFSGYVPNDFSRFMHLML